MSGFSVEWLGLREPHDHAARSAELAARLASWCHDRGAVRIVDLGAGTGSGLRALAGVLANEQHWTLVENDPALIERGTRLLGQRLEGQRETWRYDASDLTGEMAKLVPPGTDIVTASALLDLVSADWLERLAGYIAGIGAAALFSLTYDGRIRWRPGDIFDADIRKLFNEHQQRDKGLGSALGPHAVEAAVAIFERLGRVHVAQSDWVLGYDDVQLQQATLTGFRDAASEMDPARKHEIADWSAQRLRFIENQRSSLIIGHGDLLFLP